MRSVSTNASAEVDASFGSVPSLWAALRQENFALYCVLGYLIFEYGRPQSIYPWLDIFPFSSAFLAASVILSIREASSEYFRVGATWLIGLFTCLVVLSSFAAYSRPIAFENFHVYLNWLLVYIAFVSILRSPRRWVLAMAIFLLLSFKMAQHGMRVWVQRGLSFADWGLVGPPGWFENSGELGIQMCVFLPLSLAFVIAYQRHWGRFVRIIAWLMPISAIATILGSSSRGAVIGGAASIVPMVLRSKYKWKALVGASVVALIGYWLIPAEFLGRFDEAGTDRTSLTRLTRWKAGMDMMWDHPMLGVGYFNWPVYYGPTYEPGERGALLSHNLFVQVGAEMGVTSLALFVVMVLACLVLTSHIRLKGKAASQFTPYVHMANGLDGALLGYLVSGFFVTVFFYPYFWVNFAFTVALYNIVRFSTLPSARTSYAVMGGDPFRRSRRAAARSPKEKKT